MVFNLHQGRAGGRSFASQGKVLCRRVLLVGFGDYSRRLVSPINNDDGACIAVVVVVNNKVG